MGGKRPRQSHGVSVLPDGAGVASVAERYTRETDVLRLFKTHRLEPGGSGPEATRTRLAVYRGGELPRHVGGTHGEAVVTCCGVATAMSQGSSRVPPPPSDRQVNTGTVPGLPLSASPAWSGGWAHRLPIGWGWGGAAVVVRGRESRSHGEGRQWYREDSGGCNAERRDTEW